MDDDAAKERNVLKQDLKAWEGQFMAEAGRRPNASDIRNDPIAKKYRAYELLKREPPVSQPKETVSRERIDRIKKGMVLLDRTLPRHGTPQIPDIALNSSETQQKLYKINSLTKHMRVPSDSTQQFRFNPELNVQKNHSFVLPLDLSKSKKKEFADFDVEFENIHDQHSSNIHIPETKSLGETADKLIAASKNKQVPVAAKTPLDDVSPTRGRKIDKQPASQRNRAPSKKVRLSLTDNYVKYDLKHSWKSKGNGTKKRKKAGDWKSPRAYMFEQKRKRKEEYNAALYTENLEDNVRDHEISQKSDNLRSNFPNDVDHENDMMHPDFKPPASAKPPQKQPLIDTNQGFVYDGELTLSAASQVLREKFGFSSFRQGQFEAIERIFNKKSTLVVLPTGAGKTLIYQLAASMLPGLVLVITPLLSLMKDQLQRLPGFIVGAIWSSNESIVEVDNLIRRLRRNEIKILFISPERLHTSGFQRIIRTLPAPGVSFVSVDEAHCVSHWSHNFRPSFLRINSILTQNLGECCILALTATATQQTVDSVCSSLSIDGETGVIATDISRSNLFLSVSRDHDRFAALVLLLDSERFKSLSSIIIYVHQQRTADEVMFRLRSQGLDATSYHAGKDAKTRRIVQEQFMSGKIRIICATIAFGMGLDKSDVRAVIHFNTPQSMENYVQEIGRAGRDGLPAQCHAFYDEDDADRYRSLSHSNGIDKSQVFEMLSLIFAEPTNGQRPNIIALSKDHLIESFDVRDEVIETLLTFLELRSRPSYIRTLANLHRICSLSFCKTSPEILAAANHILAYILEYSKFSSGFYQVDITAIANSMNVKISEVQHTLLTLKSLGEAQLIWKDLSFCMETLHYPESISDLAREVVDFFELCESNTLRKIDIISQILKSVATEKCLEQNPGVQARLQHMISVYFECHSDDELLSEAEKSLPEYETLEILRRDRQRPEHLVGDAKVLILQWKHKLSRPRQVARILHGMSSPLFGYKEWSKCSCWGKYISYPFNKVLAEVELIMNPPSAEQKQPALKKPSRSSSCSESDDDGVEGDSSDSSESQQGHSKFNVDR